MAGRSKWLDPKRMTHGLAWRTQALIARMPKRRQPPKPPVGTSFPSAVLDSYGVEDVTQLDATRRMWAEFTLTSVDRGQRAVAILGGRSRFRGMRVLDVGCAYAGFLVAAAEAGAKEVVGIDVDPRLLDLARLLMADHAVEGSLSIASLVDPGLPDRLGQFDLIFCNDVLEHVLELRMAAANLERLLKRGGGIFLEIPNGLFSRYIESDGHYKLPGITLLGHNQAEQWFRAFYADAYPYNTFFYASLEFYCALFSREGIPIRLLNAPAPDDQAVGALLHDWETARQRIAELAREYPEKPRDLIEAIQTRWREADQRFQALLDTSTHAPNPEERDVAATTLLTTFGLDSFLLEGFKPGTRQA